MKIHIVKTNGESVLIPGVQIVYVDGYITCVEHSAEIEVWCNNAQHNEAKQKSITIKFLKIAAQKSDAAVEL